MIVVWEKLEDGTLLIHGIFATDEEAAKVSMERLAQGKTVMAGDITPVQLTYTPPKVEVQRTAISR